MSKIKHFVDYVRGNMFVAIAVVGIIIVGGLIFANSNKNFTMPTIFGKSDEQIGKDAINYINTSGLSTTPATLVKVAEASGLVKVSIKIGTSQFDSYVTKDGKLLFPQAFDMSAKKTTAAASANTTPATPQTLAKTDKPILDAFVVSSCPFGLQMQRAMAEAVKEQPALAASFSVKYIGSISNGKITSMHDGQPGGAEAQENLRQICIREQQPAKFWNYLSCYMQKASGALPNGMPLGDSKGCLASTGVDTAKLNSCVSDPKQGLTYAQKDFDLGTKYNVSGSPTLVLGDATVDETGFGGRSADAVKSIICAASKSAPSFCSTKLNTAAASASFSATYASATTGGTTAANTNCAAQQ